LLCLASRLHWVARRNDSTNRFGPPVTRIIAVGGMLGEKSAGEQPSPNDYRDPWVSGNSPEWGIGIHQVDLADVHRSKDDCYQHSHWSSPRTPVAERSIRNEVG